MTGSTKSANLTSFTELSDPVLASLRRVETDIRAGEHQAAAARLNELQLESPTDPRVLMTGVLLAQSVGNAEGAWRAVERAVVIAPRWAPALIERAAQLARRGEFERALVEADKAIAAAPSTLQVLEAATSIANLAGDTDRAARYLDMAQQAAPDNLPVRLSRGYNLLARRQFDDALKVFAAALETDAESELALAGRARAVLENGDLAAASGFYEDLARRDPENAAYRYYADIAQGKSPTAQPPEIARTLFDDYAATFDKHLVGQLGYRAPKRFAEIIRAHRPDLAFDMLDLGCGTGLMGVYLGKPRGALVGVDVSGAMIAEAIKHNVYDRFHQVDLLDALRESPSGSFDIITAADVFVYIGALDETITHARRLLRPNGLFAFSCEATGPDEPDLVLRPTQRYAHSDASMRALCEAAGFSSVEIEACAIRYEEGKATLGFLVVAIA